MIKQAKLIAYFLPLLAILYVSEYGVNVLYWDEFGLVSMFSGSGDFWKFILQPHNEHFMPLGKLEYYAIGTLTAMSSKACMYATVLVLWLPYFFLVRKIESRSLLLTLVSTVLFFLAFFSPLGSENLLWGFQLLYLSAYAFAVLAILMCDSFLRTGEARYLAAASFCCVVASLNSSHGILSWLSIFSVMLYSRQYKKCLGALIPCVLVALFYLAGRSGVAFQTRQGIDDLSFSYIATYFFSFAGSGIWSFRMDAGWIAGLIAVLVLCYLLILRRMYRNYLVTTLAVLGILLAAMVTFGRWRLGVVQAFASRYFQLQMPIYLSVGVAISYYHGSGKGISSGLLSRLAASTDFFIAYAAFVFAAGFLTVSIESIESGVQKYHQMTDAASIARDFEKEPRERVESSLFPNYDFASHQLRVLREKKLNVFSEE